MTPFTPPPDESGALLGMAAFVAMVVFAIGAAKRRYAVGVLAAAAAGGLMWAWLNMLGGYYHQATLSAVLSFLIVAVVLVPVAVIGWLTRLRGPQRAAYEEATAGYTGATGLQPHTPSTSGSWQRDPLDR